MILKVKDKEFELYIQELRELFLSNGVKVRFEKGDFKGGYCLLKNNKLIVINKNLSFQRKFIILSKALHEIGIDNIYINPRLRELIEEYT